MKWNNKKHTRIVPLKIIYNAKWKFKKFVFYVMLGFFNVCSLHIHTDIVSKIIKTCTQNSFVNILYVHIMSYIIVIVYILCSRNSKPLKIIYTYITHNWHYWTALKNVFEHQIILLLETIKSRMFPTKWCIITEASFLLHIPIMLRHENYIFIISNL